MFVASIFEVVIVKPIFNLLVLIYGILPGHNFGLSIILFTIIVRLLMWPLVKKQLHQAKAMREMQPELKRIKKATKGNRQQESLMLMELYRERGISPFGSLGTLVVQLIILIGLYSGLRRVVTNPHAIIDYSYSWLHGLPGLKALAANIQSFDATLFGLVDLTKSALGTTDGASKGDLARSGGLYIPALIIVLGSAVAQFYQSKQLLPAPKDGRSLRTILKDAGSGKNAEQSEVNAAVGQSTKYLLPFMIVLFTIGLASALSLYWLTSGIVAYIQQDRILGQDEVEMEQLADKADQKTTVIEGEVIETKTTKTASKTSKAKKRRKK
ncbi:MAG TPA: YidC/Oxa1 family membrane protein insertase [Candidatus Limnocylindrales bacterium]|nr:YidC/Oxa1 family membrane protein insertase [Candidatus Limnocylindrales bacterium]